MPVSSGRSSAFSQATMIPPRTSAGMRTKAGRSAHSRSGQAGPGRRSAGLRESAYDRTATTSAPSELWLIHESGHSFREPGRKAGTS